MQRLLKTFSCSSRHPVTLPTAGQLELDDLWGPFQTKLFYDSMITTVLSPGAFIKIKASPGSLASLNLLTNGLRRISLGNTFFGCK